MAEISISEVARRAGVRPSTLRYYEEIGLLMPARRVSGRRHYDESVLEKLAIIQTAQQAGFTLAELRVLLNDILSTPLSGIASSAPAESPAAEWHTLVQRKLDEMNALLRDIQSIRELLQDIMNCDDAMLAECIVLTGQRHRVFSEPE